MQLEELFYFYFFNQHGDGYILAKTCSGLYVINRSCVELDYVIILVDVAPSRYLGRAECYVRTFVPSIDFTGKANQHGGNFA
jgi:hypothetical protein